MILDIPPNPKAEVGNPSASSIAPPAQTQAVSAAGSTPSLPLAGSGSSLTFSSGGRALAELRRREQEALTRIQNRNAEMQALEQGLPGHWLGLEGQDSFVRLTPVSDDEAFFKQFYQNPALKVLGVEAAAPTTGNNIGTQDGKLSDVNGAASSPVNKTTISGEREQQRGILSGLAGKFSFLGWLSTNRLGVGLTAGGCIFLGLVCLITLFPLLTSNSAKAEAGELGATAASSSPLSPTPAALALNLTPTVKWEATITAQAGSLATATFQAQSQPKATAGFTSTPTITTASTLPTPTPVTTTAVAIDSSEPHGGLLAPSKLAAPKLSFSNERVRRFKAETNNANSSSNNIQTVVSSPGKGELYHLGAYPGERPGNLVLFGDYDSLGKLLELLQINDTLEVTDRNGGVYVYRVLPWEQLNSLVLAQGQTPPSPTQAVPAPAVTPGASVSTGNEVAATVAILDYRVEKITDWQDANLVTQPRNLDVSVLTLVSLNQPGEDAGRRYAVRARFVSYRPVPNLPAGTPVASLTATATMGSPILILTPTPANR